MRQDRTEKPTAEQEKLNNSSFAFYQEVSAFINGRAQEWEKEFAGLPDMQAEIYQQLLLLATTLMATTYGSIAQAQFRKRADQLKWIGGNSPRLLESIIDKACKIIGASDAETDNTQVAIIPILGPFDETPPERKH